MSASCLHFSVSQRFGQCEMGGGTMYLKDYIFEFPSLKCSYCGGPARC